MTEPDIYFKKVIDFWYSGQDVRFGLQFRVSQDLFSSHQIDVGTRFLLSTLEDLPQNTQKILDLGCGYGPIGLTLKKQDPTRIVHLVDRDALAVAYARQNADLNGIPDVEVYGSLGYDDVPVQDFDLIVSNIPGKAGESVITALLLDARHYLNPEGQVAIVIVNPLATYVDTVLASSDIEVLLRETRSDHTVFHYRWRTSVPRTDDNTPGSVENSIHKGIYLREELHLNFKNITYTLQTAYGLPEFDTLSYQSELLLHGMLAHVTGAVERTLIFNPGQGHIPVALWIHSHPNALILADRDLLSLRYAEYNLIQNGCPAEQITAVHQVDLRISEHQPVTLVMGILRTEHTLQTLAHTLQQMLACLAVGGIVLVAATSTTITRFQKQVDAEKSLRVVKRKRNKGSSLLVIQKKPGFS
ncbi:MAG: methyltransferase [Anaerolineae bacterium]|nr:methyltransferase [Anaerolineae bacterium]